MKKITIAFLIFFNISLVHGQIYVSTLGSDKNNGTKEKPVASFERAQQLAREYDGTSVLKIIFRPGNYYLTETIKFTPEDNIKNGVTYQAEKEGTVTISGGKKLNLVWKAYRENIFVADVNENIVIDQLFVNGIRQSMARYPNAIDGKSVYDTWDLSHNASADSLNDALLPSRVNGWRNPTGGYVHTMHNYLWGDMHWLIKGKIEDSLILLGGWQNNRPSKMHPL
jgi:hypothetical protein